MRKLLVFSIAAFALIAALISFDAAQTATNSNALEVVVNNTDKGILGTGERMHGLTYYANDSAIQLLLIFHVIGNGAPQTVDSNLSINGTVALDRDFKTSAGSGVHDHFSYSTIIPKAASYKVTNSSNVYQIEWREYPILTGRNGTLSLNQTIIQGTQGTTNHSNLTNLNWAAAGHTIDDDVDFNENNITELDTIQGMTNITSASTEFSNYSSFIDPQYTFNLYTDKYYNVFSMLNANSGNNGNIFGGYKARMYANGTLAPIQTNDQMFYFFGKGWDGSGWTSSRARFYFEAPADWGTSSHPTQIRMMVTDTSDVTHTVTIGSDGNITISGMAGTGNAYACFNSAGKLYRGTPTC